VFKRSVNVSSGSAKL